MASAAVWLAAKFLTQCHFDEKKFKGLDLVHCACAVHMQFICNCVVHPDDWINFEVLTESFL